MDDSPNPCCFREDFYIELDCLCVLQASFLPGDYEKCELKASIVHDWFSEVSIGKNPGRDLELLPEM